MRQLYKQIRHFAKNKNTSKHWEAERAAQRQAQAADKYKDYENQLDERMNYKSLMASIYKDREIKTRDLDLQESMQQLNKKVIDFENIFNYQYDKDKMDQKERERIEDEEKIIARKMKEAESSKVKIDFFNKGSQRLIETTDPDVLYELGIRAFTGSRDVPQDQDKAIGILQAALKRAVDIGDQREVALVEYYMLLCERKMITDHAEQNNAPGLEGVFHPDDKMRLQQIDGRIYELAINTEINEALYTIGKDFYQEIRLKQDDEKSKKQKKDMMVMAYSFLAKAAQEKVYSAYFFLGLMHIEGIYAVKNIEKGIEYLNRGAAMHNAYCFFYLSMIYHEGIHVEKDPVLEFHYLKRGAEEGFVQLQHQLGVAYYRGLNVRKNDRLALAWLREAARNGYAPSYQLAGDILYFGNKAKLPANKAVEQNRMFALTQYMLAYQSGALFLEPQIKQVIQELITYEGFSEEDLPEIKFIRVKDEDLEVIKSQQAKYAAQSQDI